MSTSEKASTSKAKVLLRRFCPSKRVDIITTGAGNPVGIQTATQTVGLRGPVLLQDVHYLDEMQHFDRERAPERVVHAKGAGAFGYFEVTHDITKYTAASIFEKIGKQTNIAVRFSLVARERGSADTARDPRGFSIKFYTDDGIWDLVGNNTPIFFIRDPVLFPSFIHSQKRNPASNLRDPDAFWDFLSLRPESTHQVLFLFGDRGIPDGYRYMHGYGSNTFKLVNAKSEAVYCKFHYKTDQGIKNLDMDQANELAGLDPDYATRDLFNAIAKGNFPSWTFYIQVMTFEEAEKVPFNPFDVTKTWPHGDFPLIQVGKLVLNRNPTNYYTEVEEIGFSVSNLVPGILPSPDKMLQGRLFSYADTQRHRIGPNYLQLPINRPFKEQVKNYQRDGPMRFENLGSTVNYYPNSFEGPEESERARSLDPKNKIYGDVYRYDDGQLDNFTQAAVFWNRVLQPDEKDRLVMNLANHLGNAIKEIQERATRNFAKVSPELGKMLKEALKVSQGDGVIN